MIRLSSLLMLLLGACATPPVESAYTPPTPTHDVVTFDGTLDYDDVERAKQLIGPGDTLYLATHGGYVRAAQLLAQHIDRNDARVVIASGTTCASACIYVLLADIDIIVEQGARVGVHSSYFSDGRGGYKPDPVGRSVMYDWMRANGYTPHISTAFVDFVYAIPPTEMYWLTTEDLRALGLDA